MLRQRSKKTHNKNVLSTEFLTNVKPGDWTKNLNKKSSTLIHTQVTWECPIQYFYRFGPVKKLKKQYQKQQVPPLNLLHNSFILGVWIQSLMRLQSHPSFSTKYQVTWECPDPCTNVKMKKRLSKATCTLKCIDFSIELIISSNMEFEAEPKTTILTKHIHHHGTWDYRSNYLGLWRSCK